MSMRGDGRFSGRVVLVTGSSRGIGRAIALRFAREGAVVAVHGSRKSKDFEASLHDVVAASPESVGITADLSESSAIRRMFDELDRRLGRIDVLVNNAALMRSSAFLEMTEDDWDRVVAVNLKAPFLCSQLAARRMIDGNGGTIINVGSVHEYQVKRNDLNYSTAKGGLLMLTKNLALELADYGIRVNHLTPGAIATAMTDSERQAKLLPSIPSARMGQPEEIAAAACFLASEEAGYVTGASFVVDGGLTLGFSATRRDL